MQPWLDGLKYNENKNKNSAYKRQAGRKQATGNKQSASGK
jgi:hypothetical protein